MDWANERYVRLYTRETDDDLMLTWEALALWRAMLIKFDRSGIIATRRGAQGLAAIVRIPVEIVNTAIDELVADGRVQVAKTGYLAPNYLAAQDTGRSDKARQQEFRERRRTEAVLQSRNGKSHGVTTSNGESQPVTSCHSDPIRTDPSEPSGARARDPIVTEDGRRNPRFRYERSTLNPDEIEAFEGDNLVGILEESNGRYREVSRR